MSEPGDPAWMEPVVVPDDAFAEDEIVVVDDEPPAARPTTHPALLAPAPGLDLDPRLQRLVALRRSGRTTTATASTEPGEVAVVAVVSNARAWERLSEVRPGAAVPLGNGESVVTGRIPLTRIEAVRTQNFVKSLKAARPLKPTLSAGVRDAHAEPAVLAPLGGPTGAGVVVGVVDYGCDFAHRNFRTTSGDTRLEAIWHQGAADTANAPYGYGRLYEREAINSALRTNAPYASLGYAPPQDNQFSKGAHGTHVMDIAAGNGLGSGAPGFAPQAALIFVDVSHKDIAFRGKDVLDTSFGDSVRLLEAVRFIFDRAGERPCVVNISLGTNGGPHDGSTPVERGLDAMVSEKPNRAVVIAASNAYADGIHASGVLRAGQSLDLIWDRPDSDDGEDELEIWTAGADRAAVELLLPDGSSLGVVEPGTTGEAKEQGRTVILAVNRLQDPNNGDNMIGAYVSQTMPAGQWTVRLTPRALGASGRVHAWIERDDRSQASFVTPRDDSHTIGSISCGRHTFVVASYDAHKSARPLSYFSSAGPTRDGRQKPELAAPGHDVMAAHSRTGDRVVRKSGTSMASPGVAGAVALLFSAAQGRGIDLTIDQTRALVLNHLRRQGGAAAWDPRWGGGRLDLAAALGALGAGTAPPAATEGTPGAVKRSTSRRGAPARDAAAKKKAKVKPKPKPN